MCSLEPASARCVGLAGGLALGPVSSVASGLRDRMLVPVSYPVGCTGVHSWVSSKGIHTSGVNTLARVCSCYECIQYVQSRLPYVVCVASKWTYSRERAAPTHTRTWYVVPGTRYTWYQVQLSSGIKKPWH